MSIGPRPSTYADIDRVPEDKLAELIDGELFVSPRPGRTHRRIATFLGGWLADAFDRDVGERSPGSWWIEAEPEIRLWGDALVPDLGGWRRERLGGDESAYHDVVPDWVCEILSASSRKHDRDRKLPLYAQWGVENCWLIDPAAQLVEIHRLESERWTLVEAFTGSRRFRAEPFEALEIDMARWWLSG